MFYDQNRRINRLIVHYAIGAQTHSVEVDHADYTLEEHIARLEKAKDRSSYVVWRLPAAGTIAIRLDSIVTLTAR